MKKKKGKTVTEVLILDAAVQLFSRNGYKGTSTRNIARLAKINEVTLFRYFPRKSELFSAAAELRLGRIRMGRELQNMLATDASLAVTVPMLTEFLVENFFYPPDLIRLISVAAFEAPGTECMVREYLGPFFDAIHAYFERCAAKGLLHEIEPSIATLGLIGVMGAHRDLYRLFTGQELDWSLEKSVPAYASFFLAALGHTPMGAVPLAGF